MSVLKHVFAIALIGMSSECTVTEEVHYPDGTVVRRTITIQPDDAVEVKPAGTVLRTSNVTFEDGSARDAEIIDTDGDGEGDHMWVSDNEMDSGGVGGPFTYTDPPNN